MPTEKANLTLEAGKERIAQINDFRFDNWFKIGFQATRKQVEKGENKMENNPKLKLKGIHQIGIVVRDLDKAMEAYWRILGIGPWRVYAHGHPVVPVTTYRGRPENYRHRVALADIGALQIELIQHLDGNTIYKEFLDRFGEGVQHLGIFVENADASAKEAEAAGLKVIQSGTGHGPNRDGAYFYIDTAEELGVVYELIQMRQKAQPERVYP